ncbi:hypothetical protein EGR_10040 [Echinococcus granulosus]|uniref:Uncharacterized protein n=1 Tax=Echinococcus granulosus TaxID=6210 RepID=W6U229_ECHGR|nr:hypothetical protein EGR_10040 [Echinococcus granulosus]EUB55103.1 hypothetical protein EGR_10040 [Echinococcus granulosus]
MESMDALLANQIAVTVVQFKPPQPPIHKIANSSFGAITLDKMDPCTSYDVHVEAFRGAVSILSYVGTIETPPTEISHVLFSFVIFGPILLTRNDLALQWKTEQSRLQAKCHLHAIATKGETVNTTVSKVLLILMRYFNKSDQLLGSKEPYANVPEQTFILHSRSSTEVNRYHSNYSLKVATLLLAVGNSIRTLLSPNWCLWQACKLAAVKYATCGKTARFKYIHTRFKHDSLPNDADFLTVNSKRTRREKVRSVLTEKINRKFNLFYTKKAFATARLISQFQGHCLHFSTLSAGLDMMGLWGVDTAAVSAEGYLRMLLYINERDRIFSNISRCNLNKHKPSSKEDDFKIRWLIV